MHGEGGVVGLDHGVGHLGGGHDGVGVHDSVGVLFSEKQRESLVLFLKCTAVTRLYQLIKLGRETADLRMDVEYKWILEQKITVKLACNFPLLLLIGPYFKRKGMGEIIILAR